MVQVAVIGAGAAGIIASRHLLRCGIYPTIFERNNYSTNPNNNDSNNNSKYNHDGTSTSGPTSSSQQQTNTNNKRTRMSIVPYNYFHEESSSSTTSTPTRNPNRNPYYNNESQQQQNEQQPLYQQNLQQHQQYQKKQQSSSYQNQGNSGTSTSKTDSSFATLSSSKYTSCFSEILWSESCPMYVTTYEMDQYLDHYSDFFLGTPSSSTSTSSIIPPSMSYDHYDSNNNYNNNNNLKISQTWTTTSSVISSNPYDTDEQQQQSSTTNSRMMNDRKTQFQEEEMEDDDYERRYRDRDDQEENRRDNNHDRDRYLQYLEEQKRQQEQQLLFTYDNYDNDRTKFLDDNFRFADNPSMYAPPPPIQQVPSYQATTTNSYSNSNSYDPITMQTVQQQKQQQREYDRREYDRREYDRREYDRREYNQEYDRREYDRREYEREYDTRTGTRTSVQDENDYDDDQTSSAPVEPQAPLQCTFKYDCTVIQIEKRSWKSNSFVGDSHFQYGPEQLQQQYRIEYIDHSGSSGTTSTYNHHQEPSRQPQRIEQFFDGVVVTAGFFSQPYVPKFLSALYQHLPTNNNNHHHNNNHNQQHQTNTIPFDPNSIIIHSSQYTSSNLFTYNSSSVPIVDTRRHRRNPKIPPPKVAIIGSSVTCAHDIASDLCRKFAASCDTSEEDDHNNNKNDDKDGRSRRTKSTTRHPPFTAASLYRDDSLSSSFGPRVIHINTNHRIPWVVPRYVPDPHTGTIVPTDLYLLKRKYQRHYNYHNVNTIHEYNMMMNTYQQQYQQNKDNNNNNEHFDTTLLIQQHHRLLEKIVGLQKQKLTLGVPDYTEPPIISLNDDYLDYVLNHNIEIYNNKIHIQSIDYHINTNHNNNNKNKNNQQEQQQQYEQQERDAYTSRYGASNPYSRSNYDSNDNDNDNWINDNHFNVDVDQQMKTNPYNNNNNNYKKRMDYTSYENVKASEIYNNNNKNNNNNNNNNNNPNAFNNDNNVYDYKNGFRDKSNDFYSNANGGVQDPSSTTGSSSSGSSTSNNNNYNNKNGSQQKYGDDDTDGYNNSQEKVEDDVTFDIVLEDGQVITGVNKVIACTGYKSNLEFIDERLLELLKYDPDNTVSPLTLCHDVYHPTLPNFAFVGMYNMHDNMSNYYGTIELQARLMASYFSGQYEPSNDEMIDALQLAEMIRTVRTPTATAQNQYYQNQNQYSYADAWDNYNNNRNQQQRQEQHPFHHSYQPNNNHQQQQQQQHQQDDAHYFNDPIDHMDTYASILDLVPPKELGGSNGDVVIPAYYQNENQELIVDCKQQIYKIFNGYRNKFNGEDQAIHIANMAFRALIGKWKLERYVTDESTKTVQKIVGTVQFKLMNRYEKNSYMNHHHFHQKRMSPFLHYREDGCTILPNGVVLDVFKDYVYTQENDLLNMYFVDEIVGQHEPTTANGGRDNNDVDDDDDADPQLFLNLQFEKRIIDEDDDEYVDDEEYDEYYYQSTGYNPQPRKIIPYTHSWYARSHHEYQGDIYHGTFDIRLDGIHAKQIIQRYQVRGPDKEYTTITILTPIAQQKYGAIPSDGEEIVDVADECGF